ncbi:phosphoglucomutase [Sesbania bispinosa]|nr:phosphoglucomutase [Sesbania bispinosa]
MVFPTLCASIKLTLKLLGNLLIHHNSTPVSLKLQLVSLPLKQCGGIPLHKRGPKSFPGDRDVQSRHPALNAPPPELCLPSEHQGCKNHPFPIRVSFGVQNPLNLLEPSGR